MSVKRFFALCALCVIFCFTFGLVSDLAYAQTDSDSAKAIDKDRATKKGIRNSLASGNDDDEEDDRTPTKPQMALGIGSVIVAYIVFKWL